MKIKYASKLDSKNIIFVCSKKDISSLPLNDEEKAFVNKKIADKKEIIKVPDFSKNILVIVAKDKINAKTIEEMRKNSKCICHLAEMSSTIVISNHCADEKMALALAEGIALSSYTFDKYLSKKKENQIKTIELVGVTSKEEIEKLSNLVASVYATRDLVNEPLNYLTAKQLSEEIKSLGKENGFKVTVFDKKKIESLRMGGLLAVNKGSIEPPTFSILEWKSPEAKNEKPIVLVGKGIVYDTGGLSLKPTGNSMDYMKSDMGGSAAVIGTMCAVAKNKLPINVIALIPATENRPGQNAYAPGDIITMYDKQTVEVLNTDAEGRMILADALAYAKQYEPSLVIDIATLTGAVAVSLADLYAGLMRTCDDKTVKQLSESGEEMAERVWEFPFHEDYAEQLKSPIADMKNVGGRDGGTITAGKFLEKFTDYPWMHIDIAGVAFTHKKDSYRGQGGTGFGVRLLYNFLERGTKN